MKNYLIILLFLGACSNLGATIYTCELENIKIIYDDSKDYRGHFCVEMPGEGHAYFREHLDLTDETEKFNVTAHFKNHNRYSSITATFSKIKSENGVCKAWIKFIDNERTPLLSSSEFTCKISESEKHWAF